jgi:hypothetical protein
MDQCLFIVAPNRPDLCDPLRSIFEDVPVKIVLDRRQGASWVPRPHQVDSATLDQLAEVLATPLVELFQAGLRAETLQREDLPALVDLVCAELNRRSERQECELLGPAAREEYAELVVGRVRRTILAALEMA